MSGRNARAGLPFLYQDQPDRVGRDQLEILSALIAGPSFEPTFRPDVIEIPRQHPIYRWECVVGGCERSRSGGTDLCSEHLQQLARERERGVGKAAFLTAATGLKRHVRAEELACRVCPQRPVAHTELRLCQRHLSRWTHHERTNGEAADLAAWLSEQLPLPGYGSCRVAVCTNLADSPLGLCPWHGSRYHRDKRPGRASLPSSWWHRYEQFGRPVPIEYDDEAAFRRWCATTPAPWWPGQINLLGLRPLVRAEIKWGLFIHTQRARPTRWDLGWIRSLVATCRDQDVETLVGFPLGAGGSAYFTGAIVKEILHELRLVYFTPAETRGRRVHRDRPLRRAVRSTRQPRRSDRDPATLVARPGLGLPRRHAAITALPPFRRSHRRNPQGSNRTGRFPGDRRARRRARPHRAARRAHAAGLSPTSAVANAMGCRRWRLSNPVERRASSPR